MSRLLEILNEGKEHDHLPASDFGLPSQRKFPMKDATGVRMAMVRFGNCKEANKHELARNIMKKAKQFSVVVKNANILKYAGLLIHINDDYVIDQVKAEKNVNDDPNIKKGVMGRLHKELLDAGKNDVSNQYTDKKTEKPESRVGISYNDLESRINSHKNLSKEEQKLLHQLNGELSSVDRKTLLSLLDKLK